jgi:hypothetical protein
MAEGKKKSRGNPRLLPSEQVKTEGQNLSHKRKEKLMTAKTLPARRYSR